MRTKSIDLKAVSIHDPFWDKYTKLVTREVIPYQQQVLFDELPDVEPSHAIRNFRIAAGLEEGDFYGFVFQDSDVAKWLEAVAYSLAWEPNGELEATADEVIALLEKAQKENGYLDTYFQIRDPEHEFTNLREGHELYCAGHLIEAGVAYALVTGKDTLLKVCERMADHIVEAFHSERLQRAIPGHEEIELALVKLYEITGREQYLQMAKEFLDRRGQEPHYFFEEMRSPHWKPIFAELNGEGYHLDYAQTHIPVRRQTKAAGHAVRAVYLYSAMADVAYYTKDEELLEACRTLYENIANRQMYVTGGIGSSGWLERFTVDFDLPNDANYAESCASIGLALFCRRMAQITGEARYMDTAETALYNTVPAGIAMDGKSFFYVNPLEVWPANCLEGTSRKHVKAVRQAWFGCACCPPNIARTLASLGEYAYFVGQDSLWVNLYASGTLSATIGGRAYEVSVDTRFPFGETIDLRFAPKEEAPAGAFGKVYLRIPGYAEGFTLLRGEGEDALQEADYRLEKGYAVVEGPFREGELLRLTLKMPVRVLRANPQVRADAGRAVLKKGPVVYCLEQEDNGENLSALVLDAAAPIQEVYREELLGGTLTLEAAGWRTSLPEIPEETLYASSSVKYDPAVLTFVPYAYWDNRTPGEMQVWVRTRD